MKKLVQYDNKRYIVRNFTIPKSIGAAALLMGSTAEGFPLLSMTRKDENVIAVYGNKSNLNRS